MTFSSQTTIGGSVTSVEVTPLGRSIENVASKYSRIKMNDVGTSETVSARQGRIILMDNTFLASTDMPGYGYWNNATYKEGLLHAEIHEERPVILISDNLIKYKGSGINDIGYTENTYDRLYDSSLYNKNFEKQLYTNAVLVRFNATVEAADSFGVRAELQPTKSMDYKLIMNSTGITDLNYRILDSNYDPKHRNYDDSVKSLERYIGDYDIKRTIQYQSNVTLIRDEYDWMPCCEIPVWTQFDGNFTNLTQRIFDVQNPVEML